MRFARCATVLSMILTCKRVRSWKYTDHFTFQNGQVGDLDGASMCGVLYQAVEHLFLLACSRVSINSNRQPSR